MNKLVLIFVLLQFLSIGNVYSNSKVRKEKNENRTLPISSQAETPKYKIGPGDRLSVRIFRFNQFNSDIAVLPDGTINLPRINQIKVDGLTINQAKEIIRKNYNLILKNPIIYLDIVSTRPIRVVVSGEVQHPGIYSISQKNNIIMSNNDGSNKRNITTEGWPTIVDAIQKAGGVTTNADLRKISLIRDEGNSTVKIIKEINYWKALKSGKLIKNHYIFDGDSIRVEKAISRDSNELFTIASSNFSPDTITVNIIGSVINPGKYKVLTSSSIKNAILIAGGVTEKSSKDKIYLIRFKENGKIENNKINEDYNPSLKNGDIILVKKNRYYKTADTISSITDPLIKLISGLSAYKFISNDFMIA